MTLLQFAQAYLFGWVFWMTLTLGCVGLTLLYHAVRGSWALPILRILEAGNKLLPVMFLAQIPILILLFTPTGHELYHWLPPVTDPVLQQKTFYLNPPFYVARQVIYFAIWWSLMSVLNRSAARQDVSQDPREAQLRANVAAPGIVAFVLTITFAYTDWVMSLDPHWFSTIFSSWFLVGAGLMTLAFATMIVTWRAWRMQQQPWVDILRNNPGFMRDMGNLMLAFTMLWAYFSLSQFLIIWSGNLPEETSYYLRRTEGVWLLLGAALIGLQFLVPFLCLLSGRTKRTPGYLFGVALLIFVMRVVDIFWTVVPFFEEPSYPLCIAGFLAFGALWLTLFAQNQRNATVLPTHDPRLQEALESGATSHA
ncbi:MAG: hypothetical protein RMJ43_07060 [Chloroherpetonaceae bacterium]|nr:hypothetical protein [Chthonomonadaceae bacterium]MDW8207580.1 hypothetical protein [Chloroherpetonaceae bacterium]